MTNAHLKPLGRKAYGSIPHLPASRMGPADHAIHPGQGLILTEAVRDRHDRIIVTEKLDGANVAVARHQGEILALGRSGHLAATAPHIHIRMFSEWVDQNRQAFDRLEEGHRLSGEWLALAHGTIYTTLNRPFVPFDLIAGSARLPFDQMVEQANACGLEPAPLLSDGPAVDIPTIMDMLKSGGRFGASDGVEGAVWRCERRGTFEFLAKYVRPDKIDGKYLPGVVDTPPIWLWAQKELES